ncbi:MAG: glycosyltransferase family protein [Verrucomicrobiota bacterium]|jgi:uncharacterized protein (TIGR00661 family)
MSKIFFSMSGEGRGHATRVRAMVEALRQEHEITLFAPGDAYSFLWPLYGGSEVRVRRIEGLHFSYTSACRLNYRLTLGDALDYVRQLPGLVQSLCDIIQREQPDLAITDFEPGLPRAAKRCGLPFLSVDHQHFLCTYDLSGLPPRLRWHARYMALVVQAYCSGQAETVVSSFYAPPLRPGQRKVTAVGVLLRPEFSAIEVEEGEHLVVYCRRFASDDFLCALAATGRPVRIYGLGERPRAGKLTFHAISENRFLRDLAGAAALVCTAGNQLVGEALALGKPVLALPEAGNHEQFINAHFLRESGAGDWVELEAVRASHLAAFLNRLVDFRRHINPKNMNGLPATLEVIRRHLHTAKQRVPALAPALA